MATNFQDLICVRIRLKESTSFKKEPITEIRLLQGAVNIYLNLMLLGSKIGIFHIFILKTELESEYVLQ